MEIRIKSNQIFLVLLVLLFVMSMLPTRLTWGKNNIQAEVQYSEQNYIHTPDSTKKKRGKRKSRKEKAATNLPVVRFELNEYTSELDNFRDTAIKSLHILSEIFSSGEFKDSLEKYQFPCSNISSKVCEKQHFRLKVTCDSTNLLSGSTVYADMTADSIIKLSLNIKHPKGKTSSYGYASACTYKINSYSWWLKPGRKLPLSQEYAIHLAHEYSHVLGYYHSKKHSRKEDVAYRMGGIVKNIITRHNQQRII